MSIELTSPPAMCDYDRMVRQNIKDLREELSDVFGNVKESVQKLAKSTRNSTTGIDQENKRGINSQRWKSVKRLSKSATSPTKIEYNIRRSARIRHESKKVIYNEQSDDDNDDANDDKKKKNRQGSLRVKFSWSIDMKNKNQNKEFYKFVNDSDFIDSDDEELKSDICSEPSSKRRRIVKVSTPRLAVSQVTQKMLDNIVYDSKKTHDPNGTTCHQCRQKTLDQKSYCRYKNCRGVRGMFCGTCLWNRYGEKVDEVLLNPKWACPPCRGCCNCSICRRKKGKIPTGPLALQAAARGFKSVCHMLSSMAGEDPEKSASSESDSDDIENNIQQENNISESKNNDESNDIEIQHNNVIGVKHNDTIEVKHYDTIKVQHNDTTKIQHNDATKIQHNDATEILHNDSNGVQHTNTVEVQHNDTTKVQYNDTTEVIHNDTDGVQNTDTIQIQNNDPINAQHNDVIINNINHLNDKNTISHDQSLESKKIIANNEESNDSDEEYNSDSDDEYEDNDDSRQFYKNFFLPTSRISSILDVQISLE